VIKSIKQAFDQGTASVAWTSVRLSAFLCVYSATISLLNRAGVHPLRQPPHGTTSLGDGLARLNGHGSMTAGK